MIDKMFDDRDHHRVSHGIVGFVIRRGQFVFLRCPHKPGGFHGSDETRFPVSAIMENQKLAAAASLRSAETARKVIEAEFQNLLAVPCPPVSGKHAAVACGELRQHLLMAGSDD